MFASRFTAFIDACSLAGALKRNILLTLAEAEFFRIRWSEPVLIETERAIAEILSGPGRAAAAIRTMRLRFKRPEKHAEALPVDMDAVGLVATVDVLRPYAAVL